MRTDFPDSQDSRMAQAESILRTCVHCGMCNAACPTYALTGSELDGPRGRIYLIKNLLEGDKDSADVTLNHLDNCLTCLACTNACPSGVDYAHLLDYGREVVEEVASRSWKERLLRGVLAWILMRPKVFSFALTMARLLMPLRRLLPASLRVFFEGLPKPVGKVSKPPVAENPHARVALLDGCVQQVVAPNITAAASALLARHGVESCNRKDVTCCGALEWHLGFHKEARERASKNIRAWMEEIDGKGLDVLVMTASGCGAAIRDYPAWFHDEPETREAAERLAAMTKDIGEYAAGMELQKVEQVATMPIAYHAACSLANGGCFEDKGRELLERVGFSLCPPPSSPMCCGSAGAYHLLKPEFSKQLGERKVKELESLQPKIIASGNIGCMLQIQGKSDIPVVHTAELLDWASGGNPPQALKTRET